jgi:hypothetical protein
MSTKHKNGPGREYPPEQLAIYAQHKDKRAVVRPLACQGGEGCWVELGPPGLSTSKKHWRLRQMRLPEDAVHPGPRRMIAQSRQVAKTATPTG